MQTIKARIGYFRCVAFDSRTPKVARYLLLAALAYLVSPIDLIPDFIPIIGQLDDLLIVPTMIYLAFLLVPDAVKADARTLSARAA